MLLLELHVYILFLRFTVKIDYSPDYVLKDPKVRRVFNQEGFKFPFGIKLFLQSFDATLNCGHFSCLMTIPKGET